MRLRRRGAPRSSVPVRGPTDGRRGPERDVGGKGPAPSTRARRETHTIRMACTHPAHISGASSRPSTGRIHDRPYEQWSNHMMRTRFGLLGGVLVLVLGAGIAAL